MDRIVCEPLPSAWPSLALEEASEVSGTALPCARVLKDRGSYLAQLDWHPSQHTHRWALHPQIPAFYISSQKYVAIIVTVMFHLT